MSLDPKANRAAREAADAKKKRKAIPPLEPPFPFTALAFDPWDFNCAADPPPH